MGILYGDVTGKCGELILRKGRQGGKLKILALDSSGLVASVALAEDDNLIAEYTVQYKKTHSQTLLPMLQEIVRMVELDLSTVARARGRRLPLKNPLFPCRRWTVWRIRCTARRIWCARLWMPEGIRYIRAFMNLFLTGPVDLYMTCALSGNSAPCLLMRPRRL